MSYDLIPPGYEPTEDPGWAVGPDGSYFSIYDGGYYDGSGNLMQPGDSGGYDAGYGMGGSLSPFYGGYDQPAADPYAPTSSYGWTPNQTGGYSYGGYGSGGAPGYGGYNYGGFDPYAPQNVGGNFTPNMGGQPGYDPTQPAYPDPSMGPQPGMPGAPSGAPPGYYAGQGYPGYEPTLPGGPGSITSPTMGTYQPAAGQPTQYGGMPNINITMPQEPSGGGGFDAAGFYNAAAMAAKLTADASMYGADKNYAVGMANVGVAQTQAANDLQARLAAVAAQMAQVDAQLQNAQLDAQTRMQLQGMQSDLSRYEMDLKNQWQQQDDAYRYAALGQQGVLGMGQLGVQQQDALTRYLQASGQINLGQQQLGLDAFLGIGNQDIARQQMTGNLGVAQGDLALRGYLGAGQLGLSQQDQQLQAILGIGGLDLQRQLGMGNLGVDQGQLALQGWQAGQNVGLDRDRLAFAQQQALREDAMRQAEFAASLRGPRDAFAQQQYIHGLDSSGVSNAVGALKGEFNQPRVQGLKGPVEPATLGTFQQDTGLKIPSLTGV